MSVRDYFVSGVAFALGLVALASAVGITDIAENLRVIRAVESRWGAGASKLVCLALSLVLFAAGGAILAGSRPVWSESEVPPSQRK